MTIEPLILLDGVSRSFAQGPGQRLHAVRDVTLSAQRGEVYGLAGKSGVGKSTLLRMINLLELPDRGRVLVDGEELTALGRRHLRTARQNIGMVFQQFNLLRNATVADNIAFPLRIHGAHRNDEITRRVADCLALVGLEEKAGSYPARLSGGQQQRVAIARALASKPAVLLCDEPTSALDAETTRSLLATLQDVNRRLGVTIVIVSHELDVLATICHRAAVIEDGAVAEQFSMSDWQAPRRTALGRELAAASAQSSLSSASPKWKELAHAG